MQNFGRTILAPLCKFSAGYADILLKDIKAETFARKPDAIDTNHPAFVYGHLALYPERLLDLIGQGSLAQPDQKFMDAFAAGKPCIDDSEGTVYPAMDAIVARFRLRHEAVLSPLADAPDEVFARTNPNEKMRDRFPTIGMLCTFLVNGHIMMHLGQISAWRRCMGLPSVM